MSPGARVGVLLLIVACAASAFALVLAHDPSTNAISELQRLREQQAVQEVQIRDARERIHALEVDMDRVAPHTIQRQP